MLRPIARAFRVWTLALLVALGAGLPGAGALAAEGGDHLTGVLNVNTATAEQLMALPGIGSAKAKAILELRDARGGFKSIDELVEVKGIGSSALQKIRPYLALRGKSTLSRE